MSRAWRGALGATLVALTLPAAAQATRNLYVASSSVAPKGVAGFDFDAAGGLVPISGSPFGAGVSPSALAMTPDGARLYVTDSNSSAPGVIGFGVGLLGGLETIAGSPFADTLSPQGTTITPDGRFLYTSKFFDDSKISGFAIGSDGSLAPIPDSPFDAGGGQVRHAGIVSSPDSKRVYVANNQKSGGAQEATISALNIRADGSLSAIQGSPFAAGANNPADLVITPDGRRLYSANIGASTGTPTIPGGTVSGFDIDTSGSLTPVPGSPVPAGGAIALGAALTPDGNRLYVSSRAGIGGFDIAADGSLSPVPSSPVAFGAGTEPAAVAATPDGRRVYVTDQAKKEVRGFDIGGDGSLTAIPGSPFPAGVGAPTFETLVITPNQPPVASFSVAAQPPGIPTLFDAAGSADSDGTILRYAWDFGDGATLADGGPSPSHVYDKARAYNVSLTVTDNEGCSTTQVFTGQVVLCNGSSAARTRAAVNVPDVTDPALSLRVRKRQKLGPAIAVRASCSEPCRAIAEGTLTVTTVAVPDSEEAKRARRAKRETFRLFRARGKLFPGNYNTLRLKLSKRVRKAVLRSLENGGKAKARISVSATDGAHNPSAAERRVVRLTRGR